MSGSHRQSRSRLPASRGGSPAGPLAGISHTREGVTAFSGIPSLPYTQSPVPRAMVASSIDTISSDDPASYRSVASLQTSTEYTPSLVSSPTHLDSLVATDNEPWSDSNFLNSVGWGNPDSLPDYSDWDLTQNHLAGWQQPSQELAWQLERSATAAHPIRRSSPAVSPITRQSLVGHPRLQPTIVAPLNLTHFSPTLQIDHSILYQPHASRPAPTVPSSSPDVHRPCPPSTSFVVDERYPVEEQATLASSVEKAVPERKTRRADRGKNVRPPPAAPRGVTKTKATKTLKVRSKPLSPRTKENAENMRYYGACWRCKKYKKPVSPPQLRLTHTVTHDF